MTILRIDPNDVSPDQIVWAETRGPDEKLSDVKLGIPNWQVIGNLRFVDSYSTNWTRPLLKVGERSGVAPLPLVLLSIPDYPSSDAATYAMGVEDARAIARHLNETATEAERVNTADLSANQKRLLRKHHEKAKREVTVKSADATRCAFDGCNRSRKFFAPDGHGYCGRHADELGIRPHGKIV